MRSLTPEACPALNQSSYTNSESQKRSGPFYSPERRHRILQPVRCQADDMCPCDREIDQPGMLEYVGERAAIFQVASCLPAFLPRCTRPRLCFVSIANFSQSAIREVFRSFEKSPPDQRNLMAATLLLVLQLTSAILLFTIGTARRIGKHQCLDGNCDAEKAPDLDASETENNQLPETKAGERGR